MFSSELDLRSCRQRVTIYCLSVCYGHSECCTKQVCISSNAKGLSEGAPFEPVRALTVMVFLSPSSRGQDLLKLAEQVHEKCQIHEPIFEPGPPEFEGDVQTTEPYNWY